MLKKFISEVDFMCKIGNNESKQKKLECEKKDWDITRRNTELEFYSSSSNDCEAVNCRSINVLSDYTICHKRNA